MSVKTPVFLWDVPVLGESADVPTDLLSLATEIENTLKALEPKFLKTAGAGDAKKLLVVSNTGAPAFAAMSGDATISEAGAITIANEAVNAAKVLALAITEAKLAGESVATAKIKLLAVTAATLAEEAVSTIKIANLAVTEGKLAALAVGTAKLAELAVTTAKIAALAVTEGKIADAAVTSRKWKPESGIMTLSEEKALGEALEDMPGMKLEITPAVPSILKVHLAACIRVTGGAPVARCGISVDAVDQADYAEFNSTAGNWATCHMVYRIALTAALHTIKVRARRQVGGTGSLLVAGAIAAGGGTKAFWELNAS